MPRAGRNFSAEGAIGCPGRREKREKLCRSERATAARGRRPGFPLAESRRERRQQVTMP